MKDINPITEAQAVELLQRLWTRVGTEDKAAAKAYAVLRDYICESAERERGLRQEVERLRGATLEACKANEIVLDELPRRIQVHEGTGNGQTHHARCMRTLLKLYAKDPGDSP